MVKDKYRSGFEAQLQPRKRLMTGDRQHDAVGTETTPFHIELVNSTNTQYSALSHMTEIRNATKGSLAKSTSSRLRGGAR